MAICSVCAPVLGYAAALVHADLSEYNILVHKGEAAVMVWLSATISALGVCAGAACLLYCVQAAPASRAHSDFSALSQRTVQAFG
jgi:hypothetical protein